MHNRRSRIISGNTSDRLAFMTSLRKALIESDKTIRIVKSLATQRTGGIAKLGEVAGRFSYTWEACVAKKNGECKDLTKTFALKVQTIRPGVGYLREVMHEVAALAMAHLCVKERICVNFPLSLAPLRLSNLAASLKPEKGAMTTAIVNQIACGHFGQWISGNLASYPSPQLPSASTLVAQVLMGVHTMNCVWHRYHNDLAGPNVLLYELKESRDFVYTFALPNLMEKGSVDFCLEIRDAPFLGVIWDFGMLSPHQTMEEGDLGQFVEWLIPDRYTDTRNELKALYNKLKDVNSLVDSFGEEAIAKLRKGKTFDLNNAKEAAIDKRRRPKRYREESPTHTYRRRTFHLEKGHGRRWEEDPLESLRVAALATAVAWFSEGTVRITPKGPMTVGHAWWGVLIGELLGLHVFELDDDEYDILRDVEEEAIEAKVMWLGNTLFGLDPEDAPERPLHKPIRSNIRPFTKSLEERLMKDVEQMKWSSLKEGHLVRE